MTKLRSYIEQFVVNPSVIVRRGLADESGKVGLLVFGKSDTPELYVKIARFKGENPKVAKEFEALAKVRRALGESALLSTVPEVNFFETFNGRRVLGLSGMSGRPMISEIIGQRNLRRKRSLEFLETGFSWLDNFRSTSWAHGDFCPKNILVDSDHLNVLDWEYGFSDAQPTFDLFYFCLKFGFWLFGQQHSEGRRYAFFKTFLEDNWFSRRVRAELAHFADLAPDFFESIKFQALREKERTGVERNFWVDLLEYAEENRGRIL